MADRAERRWVGVFALRRVPHSSGRRRPLVAGGTIRACSPRGGAFAVARPRRWRRFSSGRLGYWRTDENRRPGRRECRRRGTAWLKTPIRRWRHDPRALTAQRRIAAARPRRWRRSSSGRLGYWRTDEDRRQVRRKCRRRGTAWSKTPIGRWRHDPRALTAQRRIAAARPRRWRRSSSGRLGYWRTDEDRRPERRECRRRGIATWSKTPIRRCRHDPRAFTARRFCGGKTQALAAILVRTTGVMEDGRGSATRAPRMPPPTCRVAVKPLILYN
ncbi:MAG: hypothetical protein JWO70_3269 [Betaproteobacteria bacterium]|nr:hypothetical protein [Betaproteobacteria bacterium]